jgi:hypothetical protein
MKHTTWIKLALFLVGLVAGCERSPRAPLLRDEPVYQNSQGGFRFQAPHGWTQVAKGDWPAKATQERLLVEYKAEASEQPAGLQVMVVDLPESTNLDKYLVGASFASGSWRPTGTSEILQISGVEARRHTFESGFGNEKTTREVVTFRRQGRVFLFTGIFSASDSLARDQIRAAVNSIIWK